MPISGKVLILLMSVWLWSRTHAYRFLARSHRNKFTVPVVGRSFPPQTLIAFGLHSDAGTGAASSPVESGYAHKKGGSPKGTPVRKRFYDCIQARDHDGAMTAFNELTAEMTTIKDSDYFALLGVCYKAEHLPIAESIIEKVKKNLPPGSLVPAYMSLIRCYTDGGRLNDAVGVIQDMIAKKVELRPRVFQPLVDALSQEGNLQRTLAVLKYMLALKVPVNEEQLVPFLSLLGHAQVRDKLDRDGAIRGTFHAVMREVAVELLGVYRSNALQIVQATNEGVSSQQQVEDQGILVETAADIKGDVVSSTLQEDGRLVAQNTTYPTMKTLLASVSPMMENEQEAMTRPSEAQTVPERYTVLYENGTRSLLPSHLTDEHTTRFLRSRIVGISSRTCRCPNCDRQIAPLGLTETDKAHIRDELFKLVRMSRGNLLNNLNDFGRWLRTRPEFEYIVDGANVAYNMQNFEHGRFSFAQIELVVDKLTELGKRALVIVPGSYISDGRVPNSSKKNRVETYLNDEDRRVIKKLQDAGNLYVAPAGSNDDWYWLYATVYEGRSRPAFVVSNDYMRDHHDIFPDMKAFMRWRSQQIVFFSFSKACTQRRSPRERMPEVSLYLPEKVSREIQRTAESWHIPIVDRDAWLCVNLDRGSTAAVGDEYTAPQSVQNSIAGNS